MNCEELGYLFNLDVIKFRKSKLNYGECKCMQVATGEERKRKNYRSRHILKLETLSN